MINCFKGHWRKYENQEPITVKLTDSYLILRCTECKKFQAWFTYEKNEKGDIINVRFFRTINLNHLMAKHKRAK